MSCNECHTKDSLLKDLTGFYMPGRDSFEWLSQLGWLAAALSLAGVLVHMALRIFLGMRNGRK